MTTLLFLSTLSLRRATLAAEALYLMGRISIHALLAESDGICACMCITWRTFLSTLSLRRATFTTQRATPRTSYFYPRSPCGERRICACMCTTWRIFLSTLSLRRATLRPYLLGDHHHISIHALLAESDYRYVDNIHMYGPFLSTLSLRRATLFPPRTPLLPRNFYPRSPCGERRATYRQALRDVPISIHALLAESDGCTRPNMWGKAIFLSTLSLRRATHTSCRCRVRPRFLSTLSLRRATRGRLLPKRGHRISIHALLAESDCAISCFLIRWNLFLSTLSLRRATGLSGILLPFAQISIHALLAESDLDLADAVLDRLISIHALLAESDQCARAIRACPARFLSTLSLRRATRVARLVSVHRFLFLSTLSLRRATKTG